MNKYRTGLWLVAAGLLMDGCAAQVPAGPNVMVMPGSRKTFEEFEYDDHKCREWAHYEVGRSPAHAANDTAITGAAVGTVLGAAAGAAIGAVAGDPATGAAVGAGVGLLGGAAAGSERGDEAAWTVQRRYDNAYTQCMYANGHQVPMPRGSRPAYSRASTPPPPPPSSARRRIPPPPRGNPPPPPPDVDW